MRLVLGTLGETAYDTRDVSWRTVREVEPELARLFGVQIALVIGFFVLVLWVVAHPSVDFTIDAMSFVAVCVVLALLHELAHAAVFPRTAGGTRLLEFRPTRLLLCARYTGTIPRNRYVAMLAAPFVALSVVPVVLCAALGFAPSEVVAGSFVNALASGGDVLAVILVLAQVPSGGSIRMERDRVAWRAAPVTGAPRLESS